MAVIDDITSLYLSILGRQPDSAGLGASIAAVNAGATLADVAAAITASPEAKIVAIYQRELGRVPEPQAVQNDTAFLARGGSTADIANNVAASNEAAGAIRNLYELVLGRGISAGDYSSEVTDQQALSNGSSLAALRAAIALSPESQANLNAIFQAEVGRPAPAGPTAPFTQTLVNGGSIADVKAAIANAPEIIGDVVHAYQVDAGIIPNTVEIAAAQSELLSGFPIAAVLPEIAQLTAGSLKTPADTIGSTGIYILPETIGAPAPNFVYGLSNNDALISSTGYLRSSSASLPIVYQSMGYGSFASTISVFTAATDILQLQSTQVSSFSNLKLSPLSGRYLSGTTIDLGSQNYINIYGVAPSALQASNFRFV